MPSLEKIAVTVGRSNSDILRLKAQEWATELCLEYLDRKENEALDILLKKSESKALLVATNIGPKIYSRFGNLFFHPSMAVLRLQRVKKRETDHFVNALALRPGSKVLDCTMGLASDAAIASFIVGSSGQVVALEASQVLHFLVSKGLKEYKADDPDLNIAMQRIVTHCVEAEEYLQQLQTNSFDVVYFDPMFEWPVSGSSNMEPLRPVADERPISIDTIKKALKVAPRVVIKERDLKILQKLGCTEILGGRYSRIKYGIVTR